MERPHQIPSRGDIISGRYEILEKLGTGGFGAVYKARQLGMNREVALKMLLPQFGDMEGLEERFRREAMLASDLVNPHTIRLYEFGVTETGLLFIAMELLRGSELDKALKVSGSFSAEKTIRIAKEILESLGEAHQHSIVHRDLKPSNVFLTEVGRRDDFVKVLDFGIAKTMSHEEADQKLTATGQALGTPYYMGPEQIRGKDIGPHTDIYSLGLMMIEMLTGRVAVQGSTPIETVLMQVSEDELPLPEGLADTALGYVIARAIRKDWRERYQTCEAMIADLERVDAGLVGPLTLGTGPSHMAMGRETGQVSAPHSFVDSGQMRTSGVLGNSGMHSGAYGMPSQQFSGPHQAPISGPYQAPISGPYPAPTEEKPRRLVGILVALLIVLLLVGGVIGYLVTQGSSSTGDRDATAADNSGGESKDEGGSTQEQTDPELASNTNETAQNGEASGSSEGTDASGTTNTAEEGASAAANGETNNEDEASQPDEGGENNSEGTANAATEDGNGTAAPVARVEISLNITPEGARIYREDILVGETPYVAELPAGEGTETWLITHDKYEDLELQIDMTRGGYYKLALDRKRDKRDKGKDDEDKNSNENSGTSEAVEDKGNSSVLIDEDKPKEKLPEGNLIVD